MSDTTMLPWQTKLRTVLQTVEYGTPE